VIAEVGLYPETKHGAKSFVTTADSFLKIMSLIKVQNGVFSHLNKAIKEQELVLR